MTRLAIAADLHVDDYYARVDPATGLNARFVDMLGTVGWIAMKATELECDALVIAGDFTESKTPPRAPRVVKIAEALAQGPERQIHLRGNHDGQWAGASIVTDLARRPGWTGHMEPGIEVVDDLAVCLIPFLDRRWLRAQPGFESIPDADVWRVLSEQYLTIARGLHVQAIGDRDPKHAILVGHQQLAGGWMTDAQASFLGDQDLVVDARALAAIGYKAVIFGHVHRGQTVVDDPACPVVFVGSPERVDFAEELEAKGFLVVDVEDERATITRIATPARPYLTIRGDGVFDPAGVDQVVVRAVDLDPDVDVVALRRALEDAGAFVVTEVTRRRAESTAAARGMSEAVTAEEALPEYFVDDNDRGALVELGREILAEVVL